MNETIKQFYESLGALEYLVKQVEDESIKQRMQEKIDLLEQSFKQLNNKT